jgi:hypothetical protein
MKPKISLIIRYITYYNLININIILNCNNLYNFNNNIIFINHFEIKIELKNFREVKNKILSLSK